MTTSNSFEKAAKLCEKLFHLLSSPGAAVLRRQGECMSWTEPPWTCNGMALTPAQAMTARVALESFASTLRESGLGDDENGRAMTRAYIDRINELRGLIFGGTT